ncbi:MAG: CRISPR-associated endoribonuclease Cas6 [Lachnospiraceae bacterium]|nr:CRISPR-associated endoribonuclease Cas6 [Lachnospiraceae bacterium]
MLVFEYQCRISFGKNILYESAAEKIAGFIDSALALKPEYLEFHQSKEYKYYCFDLPYPFEKGKVYEEKKVYTVRIRTVKQELAEYFLMKLPYHSGSGVYGHGGELKIIPRKILETVYSLTPVVLKTEQGYWRNNMTMQEYERRLKENLVKKYNQFTGNRLDEDFQLYELMEIRNQKPVKIYYKGITLLGEKLSFVTAKNASAQEIWYFALGTGIAENNSRGCGFLNYRYL